MPNAACAARPVQVADDFEAFFRHHYASLVRALYVVTADLGEAEDLAQEAMVRVYERWNRVGAMESPGGYTYKVAMNLHRKRARALFVRRHRQPWPTMDADETDFVAGRLDLQEALLSIPKGQREAVALVELMGFTSDQAGEILQLEPASVRSRLHRARAALRARLQEGDAG